MAYELAGIVPVGACLTWLKSFTNTPTLNPEFVECNGQTLSDAQSVFNGQVIPNLNGASSVSKKIIRGSTTSGTTGGVATHVHGPGTSSDNPAGLLANLVSRCFFTPPTYDMATADITPPYYEVVHAMRIK